MDMIKPFLPPLNMPPFRKSLGGTQAEGNCHPGSSFLARAPLVDIVEGNYFEGGDGHDKQAEDKMRAIWLAL